MPSSRRIRHRLLSALDRIPPLAHAGAIAVTAAGSWAALAAGADPIAARHLFFIPVVLAGIRFGMLAGVGTAVAASLLSGPLSVAEDPISGVWRGVMFVVLGGMTGLLASARADTRDRERHLVERERALVAERAALVQVVSHEFRTPLTVIRGGVQTLRDRDGAVDPTYRSLVEATFRSVGRLERMLDVVLAAAGDLDLGPPVQREVDLGALVLEAADPLDGDVLPRLRLQVPDGTSLVTVDRDLRMILRCLLDNAARFSPDASPIHVGCRDDGARVLITIRDEGPGLPPGFERSAFEPFTQADTSVTRRHGGLGMGLHTARELARRLGGDITLRSAPAQGTTVQVELPHRCAPPGEGVTHPVDDEDLALTSG